MNRLLIVVAVLAMFAGAVEARHYGGYRGSRSCYRGSYYRGHRGYYHGRSYYRGWGCGPYYRGYGSYIGGAYYGSGYGIALGFSSGYCYPSVGVSYYGAYPATYAYPVTYAYPAYVYYPPATYVYPGNVATVQSASTAAAASAACDTAATPALGAPPKAPTVRGWYHPTYHFHCTCHGFQDHALANHSYQYDTSKD